MPQIYVSTGAFKTKNLSQILEICIRNKIHNLELSSGTDFAEGVRALLIEKDNNPAWRYATMGEVPGVWVEEHFTGPWDQHPMADLAE